MFDFKSIPKIPTSSGCYIMKNSSGSIIYIGKAKNIKKRLQSYFNKEHFDKTAQLVKEIADIDFVLTDNELEALLLEAKLIYKHKPKYNIDLKNTERYSYIKITDEEFPRVMSVRKVNRSKDTFFGPYADGGARRNTVYILNKIFKLRTCKRLPKSVCLLYHIGQCSAPCEDKISKTEYLQDVKKAQDVLKGRQDIVLKKLEQEMYTYSKKQQFEQAKVRRDQIESLKRIAQRQKVSLKKSYDQDFIYFLLANEKLHIQVFNVKKGLIGNRKHFSFDILSSQEESMESFLRNFYYNHQVPQEVVTNFEFKNNKILEKYLSELRGTQVKIIKPQKGVKKDLLELVRKNAELNLSYDDSVLLELKEKLNLQTLPEKIECFDISNIGPRFTVGAMVHFANGRPDKNNYRRFKIKTVKGQDDFAMMAEIVRRRYSRLQKEQAEMPDLIVIDGGPGQLSAAFNELQKLELSIPIVSLAKKEEIVYFVGEKRPLKMSHKSESLKLLQRCRNEVHRFGIAYHRLLRSKGMLGKK